MAEIDKFFPEAARERIRAAVEKAEERTSGEIVPYVVDASDTYPGAVWRSAILGALLLSLVAFALYERVEVWALPPVAWILGPLFVGVALGYLAATIPIWRRTLIGEEILELRTLRRASVAFLEEEVFKTRDRSGILLFLSLFEHRVVVLGDEGINRQVPKEEWEAIVTQVTAGIRSGQPAEALIAAIGACGDLLERRGVEIQPDDLDELSDELRRRDS